MGGGVEQCCSLNKSELNIWEAEMTLHNCLELEQGLCLSVSVCISHWAGDKVFITQVMGYELPRKRAWLRVKQLFLAYIVPGEAIR